MWPAKSKQGGSDTRFLKKRTEKKDKLTKRRTMKERRERNEEINFLRKYDTLNKISCR